jgi:hypothetical protein
MLRVRRFAYLFVGLVAAAAAVPAPSEAAQQMACSAVITTRSCGFSVVVDDPDKPCIERDGKAYCPVFRMFYPVQIA